MAVAEVPAVSLDDVVCVAPTQVSSQVGDEVAILHMDKAVYYGLNPVGARIWQLVQKPVAVRKVLEKLLEEYDVVPKPRSAAWRRPGAGRLYRQRLRSCLGPADQRFWGRHIDVFETGLHRHHPVGLPMDQEHRPRAHPPAPSAGAWR